MTKPITKKRVEKLPDVIGKGKRLTEKEKKAFREDFAKARKKNPTKKSLRFMDDLRYIGGVKVTESNKKAARETISRHRAQRKKKAA